MSKNKDESKKKTDDTNDQNVSRANPASKIQMDQISESGAVVASNGRYTIYCLTIAGEIEGHYIADANVKTTKYDRVIPQLVAIEESPQIDGLLMLLNTMGGDIEAGLSLAELVSGMKKPTVSMVIGGGHSIGVPLAVSAQRTFIAKSASMMLHPVRSTGTTLGTVQGFEYLRRMQDRITKFVAANSDITRERFLELVMNTEELDMDIGTVLDGCDAVDEGLIDSVGGLSDAIECLYEMIDEVRAKRKSDGKCKK